MAGATPACAIAGRLPASCFARGPVACGGSSADGGACTPCRASPSFLLAACCLPHSSSRRLHPGRAGVHACLQLGFQAPSVSPPARLAEEGGGCGPDCDEDHEHGHGHDHAHGPACGSGCQEPHHGHGSSDEEEDDEGEANGHGHGGGGGTGAPPAWVRLVSCLRNDRSSHMMSGGAEEEEEEGLSDEEDASGSDSGSEGEGEGE